MTTAQRVAIEALCRRGGVGSPDETVPVTGGSICHAFRIRTTAGRLLLAKVLSPAPG